MKTLKFVIEFPMEDNLTLSPNDRIEIAETIREDLRGYYEMGDGPGPDDRDYNFNINAFQLTVKPL